MSAGAPIAKARREIVRETKEEGMRISLREHKVNGEMCKMEIL